MFHPPLTLKVILDTSHFWPGYGKIRKYVYNVMLLISILRSRDLHLNLRIDRGSLRGALHFCTSFLNYDSCYSTLYIFWKVIFIPKNG